MAREACRLTADFISPLVSSNPIPSLIPQLWSGTPAELPSKALPSLDHTNLPLLTTLPPTHCFTLSSNSDRQSLDWEAGRLTAESCFLPFLHVQLIISSQLCSRPSAVVFSCSVPIFRELSRSWCFSLSHWSPSTAAPTWNPFLGVSP